MIGGLGVLLSLSSMQGEQAAVTFDLISDD